MCGIFGYVGSRDDAPQLVLEGLKKLEYRGYDSWGLAVRQNGCIAWEKHVGKIGAATTSLPPGSLALGHTRWATHGGVTDQNAHPHLDCSGQVAVIHNGIVENYQALRDSLQARGHRFRSQTDTEVIAHLLEEELAAREAGPDRLAAATMAVLRRLEGLNAIGVLDLRSQQLAAARRGSPLVLGWGKDGNFLASDPSALLEHTRRLTFLEDGQVAVLDAQSIRCWDAESGLPLEPPVREVAWSEEFSGLNGRPHYMIKEIEEQPAVLRRLARDGKSARALAGLIRGAYGTFMVGCGTAANAALVAQYLFSRIAAHHVNFATGSEFAYLEHFLTDRSLVVALSQSGETIDVLDSARAAKERGARIAALVNVEGSSLYRLADHPFLLGAGPERCVLATKSFTAKLAVLLLTAHALAGRLEQGQRLVEAAADEIDDLLTSGRTETIRRVAERIADREHLYIIGRGPSYPLALEAALKVKEVSYIHAEGFAGGELKHGVIALVEEGTPCLVLAPNDETRRAILNGAMEVRARGGWIVGIGPERDEAFDAHIPVADLGDGSTIAQIVPAQLLAYHLALLRGHDPDKPRNLAKSVTVK